MPALTFAFSADDSHQVASFN
jgi:hypothetical protein